MSTIIKNGTIVTADLTYKADVRIEDGTISDIGPNLSGETELDATVCYVMPGGVDPHTHLEMPFMGTYSTDDFESGTRAALSVWRDHHGRRLRASVSRTVFVGSHSNVGQQINPR